MAFSGRGYTGENRKVTVLSYEKALEKLTRYCAEAEHCKSDVQKKLALWHVAEDDCERVMAYLVREKYIDEERYARAFVEYKQKFCGWGEKKIMNELLLKRIDKSVIVEAVAEVYDNDEADDTLEKLIESKYSIKRKSTDDKYKLKASLVRFGVSRGFDYEEVIAAVDKVLRGADD